MAAFFDLNQENALQADFCLRARRRADRIASCLINEKGIFNPEVLSDLISSLEKQGYLLGGINDSDLTLHQLYVLKTLQKRSDIVQKLQRIGLPLCHTIAEELIQTVEQESQISDVHVRRALLSALLCPLRQNVGSCFATAPAILIQSSQVEHLFFDLVELLTTGQLSRTFDGEEFTVPMSPSFGKGGHPLLRTWEYTLASLSDVKLEFSRWNLYNCLGLNPEQDGGIGQLIYSHLQNRLDETNQKIEQFHNEVVIAAEQLRATEKLAAQASSEREVSRLRAEHQSRLYHLRSCEEIRDKHAADAARYSHFFSFLIKQLDGQIKTHFQEIYDPEMSGVQIEEYNDSPAGFRLLYKHGRSHTGSWSFIHNGQEYIQSLSSFFVSAEHHLIADCDWETGKKIIAELTTQILHHIQNEKFLKIATKRMAHFHGKEATPWSYISGGTLPTLLRTYFRRQAPLTEESRWVESPADLCIFIIDTLKNIPPIQKRLLICSPTHVFLLEPWHPLFREAIEARIFTYTWVRDTLIAPRQQFYQNIRLTAPQQLYLMQKLCEELPPAAAHHLKHNFHPLGSITIPELRKEWLEILPVSQLIDGVLYDHLPLIDDLTAFGVKLPSPFISRIEAHQLLASTLKHTAHEDQYLEVQRRMIAANLSPPAPLVFADTNWPKYSFSFVFNPATEKLELWRTDKYGITGRPMTEWSEWLSGKSKDPWTIYIKPVEYS